MIREGFDEVARFFSSVDGLWFPWILEENCEKEILDDKTVELSVCISGLMLLWQTPARFGDATRGSESGKDKKVMVY